MKIMMTGSNGFIGAHLLNRYWGFGVKIIPIYSDVTVKESLRKEIEEKSKGEEYTILHLGSVTDVNKCEQDYRHARKVNVHGTYNLMDILSDKGSLILFSSCHVYDGNKYFPYSEKHKMNPVNAYGMTKLGAEMVLGSFPDKKSLVLRLGKIYDDGTLKSILGIEKDEVPSFITRNFMHISDLKKVLYEIVFSEWDNIRPYKKHYAKTLNIGNPDQNFSYHQFYNLVRQKYDYTPLENRSIEIAGFAPRPFRCKLNLSQMKKVLSFDGGFRSL